MKDFFFNTCHSAASQPQAICQCAHVADVESYSRNFLNKLTAVRDQSRFCLKIVLFSLRDNLCMSLLAGRIHGRGRNASVQDSIQRGGASMMTRHQLAALLATGFVRL